MATSRSNYNNPSKPWHKARCSSGCHRKLDRSSISVDRQWRMPTAGMSCRLGELSEYVASVVGSGLRNRTSLKLKLEHVKILPSRTFPSSSQTGVVAPQVIHPDASTRRGNFIGSGIIMFRFGGCNAKREGEQRKQRRTWQSLQTWHIPFVAELALYVSLYS